MQEQPKQYKEFANKPNDGFLSIELFGSVLGNARPHARSLWARSCFSSNTSTNRRCPRETHFWNDWASFFDEAPEGYQFAVETRNPNYLSPAYFDFLRCRNIAHVFLDGYYMPRIGEVLGKHDTQTADFSIVRLHGPNRQDMEKITNKIWNKVVERRDGGIASALEIVKQNAKKLITTYVNVNNHYEGSAPLTIERFLDALEKTA